MVYLSKFWSFFYILDRFGRISSIFDLVLRVFWRDFCIKWWFWSEVYTKEDLPNILTTVTAEETIFEREPGESKMYFQDKQYNLITVGPAKKSVPVWLLVPALNRTLTVRTDWFKNAGPTMP